MPHGGANRHQSRLPLCGRYLLSVEDSREILVVECVIEPDQFVNWLGLGAAVRSLTGWPL